MKLPNRKGFAPIAVLVILGVLGIGGTATVIAADSAKPGDLLYGIDQAVENVQLALATAPEAQEQTRVDLAEERITEINQLLTEKGVDSPGLNIALANLQEQKRKVAELLAQQKAQGKAVEQKAKELEKTFDELKAPLKFQKKQLKAQLKEAIAPGDRAKAEQLRTQVTQIEAQLKEIEAKEEAEKAEEESERVREKAEKEKD